MLLFFLPPLFLSFYGDSLAEEIPSFGSRCVLVTAKLSHFVFLPGRDIYVSWKSTQYDEHADRLIIPLKISSSYTCVKFYYRMWGVQIGRLNVYFRDLHEQDRMLWRLFGDQNSTWKEARIPVEITDLHYEVNLFFQDTLYGYVNVVFSILSIVKFCFVF